MSASNLAVFKIHVSERVAVTTKVDMPSRLGPETPALILAHGANNDLDHPLLATLAKHLSMQAGTIMVRFNFPYAERGSGSRTRLTGERLRRVHDHVVDRAARLIRRSSNAVMGRRILRNWSRGEEGEGLLTAGLVELGYPLHRPGRKETLFTEPLRKIGVPSLFCIGENDPFCDPDLLRPLLEQLLHPGRLYVVAGGDHSLHRAGAGKARVGADGAAAVGAATAATGTGTVASGAADEFLEVAEVVAQFIGEVTGGQV
jgi:predicted alpha/beta-hydrolase family hydrolase